MFVLSFLLGYLLQGILNTTSLQITSMNVFASFPVLGTLSNRLIESVKCYMYNRNHTSIQHQVIIN